MSRADSLSLFTIHMKRAPVHDDDDAVTKKGKVLTKPPPILLDELIEEILLRIPATSLLRLRNSICTSWRTLISSSQFTNDHRRHLMALDADRALTHTRIAYYGSVKSYPTIGVFSLRSVFKSPPHHESTQVVTYEGRHYRVIIGSCNGLLCLLDEDCDGDGFLRHRAAMLWNPCTGLTSPPLEIGGAFMVCGFGYDHVNDKYKLFGIVEKKHCESVTRIFTFGPNSSWRTMQYFPHRPGDRNNRAFLVGYVGLFVSGTATLNWLLYGHYRSNVVSVISLDLVNETYTQFSLPSRDSDDNPDVYPELCILRGCLAVSYETKRTNWTLWLMKEYGVPQSWTKLAIIPHHRSLFGPPSSIALRPIHMLKNDVLLAIAPGGKFVLLNLNDGSIHFPKFDSSSDGMSRYRPLSQHKEARVFHLYHETLVSPSHFGLPTCSSEMRLIKPTL
ncbi:hypothetical protein PIB30_074733 [Stylosanthes scabra]|uniref:F-box domain-containing protein n=1 Tax=Stylosanthes scabra TaxID=79078 RepID=A0ABU6XRL2_9FABA|nr:hypothetical protein [Stylosanthes scabra]